MASTKDIYGDGDELKADDIPAGVQVPVKITSVKVVTFDDGKKKLRISFEGKKKHVTLNVTNCKRVEAQYGDDFELWPGKGIHLMRDMTEYKGDPVKCVRVVPVELVAATPAAPIPQAAAAQPLTPAQVPLDEIPF